MALFSEQAVTGSQSDREGIRREYAQLFASTRWRELRLSNFRWQISGQAAIGKGTYTLKTNRAQAQQPDQKGTLIIDVGPGPQGPLINGLFQSAGDLP
jgi:hypothetical protein